VLLAWADDRDGRRLHVSALDPGRRGDRAPFACLGCGEPLVARLGSHRARHFAHRPGSCCPLTRPESILHLNAKERLRFLCVEALAGRLFLRIGARCPSCRREVPVDVLQMGDAVTTEGAIGALRADVLVTRAGAAALALEVKVTHGVDPEKERALSRAGIPAVEIDAREPWEEELAGGVGVRVARSFGFERCDRCAASARADADRNAGGEAAAIAELEAYRSRGLMGPPPGREVPERPPISARERAALERGFLCPECHRRDLAVGTRLVQHPCAGAVRPVAWRGYDGVLVELAWWRRPPGRQRGTS